MRNNNVWAGVIGTILLILFTVLLVTKQINELTYSAVIVGSMLVSITIAVLPRLSELDLKNLRLVLAEIKKTKTEIEELYGGIENIKRIRTTSVNHTALGLNATPGQLTGHMGQRYVMGCMKRERERLAKIFVAERPPEKLAEAILDITFDQKVFLFTGPGFSIDDPLPPHIEPDKPAGK